MFSSAGNDRRPRRLRGTLVFLAGVSMAANLALLAESGPDDAGVIGVAPTQEPTYERILGVIPNFQTVSDPDTPFVHLTVKEKWKLFAKESYDPFTGPTALIGAAFSQRENDHPQDGNAGPASTHRFAPAVPRSTPQTLHTTPLPSLTPPCLPHP